MYPAPTSPPEGYWGPSISGVRTMPAEKLDAGIPILVAESDPWSKASLKRIFKEFQFSQIEYIDNVYKATHLGRFEKFGLIIIGNDLEKGDSLNVVAQIRSEGKNTKTPIIFLYGESQEDAGKKAVSEGASGTLERPVLEPAFRELIEKLLDKYILTATLESERNQENSSATLSSVHLGQKLLAQGDMEGAEAAFEEAMMTGGGSADVFNGLAEVYLARGDKEAAEKVLVEAERLDPQARDKFELRDQGMIRSGQAALSKGDLESAEEAFEQALVKGGEGTVDAFCGLAQVYLNKGEPGSAGRALKEAEKINSMARDVFKEREPEYLKEGYAFFKEEKLEEAKLAFESAVAVNPDSVAGYAGLGEVLKAMGDDEAAAKAFEDALNIEKEPDDLHVYNRMGIAARKDKNYGVAVRSFDRALSFDQSDPVLYYNKAMVYVAKSEFEECRELLGKALELKPDFVQAEQAREKVHKFLEKKGVAAS